jgi:glycosyltransferase involved in cell wall biosynthesis
MSRPRDLPPPDISIIIPVVERHGDLGRLYDEYAAQVESLGKRAEFIFVVDKRQEHTLPDLRAVQARAGQEVILVVLGAAFGEAAGLRVGLDQARAEIIVTAAAYLQVDPAGLAEAVGRLQAGADLVVARRHPRKDSLINRLQTRVFHWVVGLMTGSSFGDISCGFRAMRRSLAQELTVYGGLHRFIPILARRHGYAVDELKLAHRPEDTETRFYGLGVYVRRLLDVLTVFFLIKFTYRPLRFFGILGVLLATIGGSAVVYLAIYRILGLGPIADRPLLLFAVLLFVLGVQILALGLIGEIIVFTHTKQIEHYRVAEIIRQDQEAGEVIPEERIPWAEGTSGN